MRFFDKAEQAVAAGYRACKRCKPDEQSNIDPKLISVARYIEAHADESLTLNKLAKQFELSAAHLQKTFKAAIGLSPKAFQNGIRHKEFKALLKSGESVTDAVFAAGYGVVHMNPVPSSWV